MDDRVPDGSPTSAAEHLVPVRVREFTALVEQLFEDLIETPLDRIDDGLVEMLGAVSRFLGTDRGFVIRYDHDSRTISMTHEWCAPGIDSAMESEQDRSFDELPREQARLLRHEINEIRDTSDLPEGWELDAVDRLRKLGVRLAIDDFGTGYSSLQVLKSLPIDVVKIDRSFVTGLPADPEDRAIVETILRLAEVLGLGVTAEGVERAEQLEALLEMGCRSVQGFLYSRPVPRGDFERILTTVDWPVRRHPSTR